MEMRYDLIKVKQIPIVDYCEKNGMQLIGKGGNYKRLKNHDSCVINTEKNLFTWNSRSYSGSIIDFAMAVKSLDFGSALRDIAGSGTYNLAEDLQKSKEKVKQVPFNEKNIQFVRMKHAYAYLINTRKLSKQTVDLFLQSGILAQGGELDPDTNKVKNDRNVVFKNIDNKGKIIGVELIGTNTTKRFKKVIEGSQPGIYFKPSKKPSYVFFTEASIDMMSFYELYKNQLKDKKYWIVSMTGLKDQVIENTRKQLDQLKIQPKYIISVDRDNAGIAFYNKIKNKQEFRDINMCPFLPKRAKDWNDLLKSKKEVREEQKTQTIVKNNNEENNQEQENASKENITKENKFNEENKQIKIVNSSINNQKNTENAKHKTKANTNTRELIVR